MTRQTIIWLAVPVGIILIIAAGILALPGLVASADHRATIEALASSLAGRKVHIAGSLSLNIFPQPRISAGNVTIDGTNGETIKARSLTLDVSMPALLRGQLTANNLVLTSPVITFPWPLPGGPTAVAPPPWLTTLHAQIDHGRISFGELTFSDISADIFTGSQGALSISGSGKLAGQSIDLTMSLGAIDLAGQAPLAVTFITSQVTANFSGQFSTGNIVKGKLQGALHGQSFLSGDAKQDVNFSSALDASPAALSWTGINLTQGGAHLSGSARFDVASAALTTALTGADIICPSLPVPGTLSALQNITIHSEVSVDRLTFSGITLPHFNENSDLSTQGLAIADSAVSLPGNTLVSLSGKIDQNSNIHAQAHLNSDDLEPFLTRGGGLQRAAGDSIAADLSSPVTGSLTHMNFANITGTLNAGPVTGSALITAGHPLTIDTNLKFKQLSLVPAAFLLQAATANHGIAGNFEISADHANLATLSLTHLLIDGGFSGNLTIRRLSASLYDGMMLGSLTMQPDGTISAAHALISLPSASPLAAILPAGMAIPSALLNKPFALSVAAAGPPNALATEAVATLGQFSASAAPLVDLTKYSAAGPITLRHPSAIAAFKLFGLNAGLAWPGAGSISLRADFSLSNDGFALPNFVASIGDLTAAGKISRSGSDEIDGDITADTLALPPLPTELSSFWQALPSLHGKVGITANHVLIAGNPWLGTIAATVTMQPGKLGLNIGRAEFAGGILKGDFAIAQAHPKPPTLTVNLDLANVDVSKINSPVAFPVTLPSGIASASISINANGFTPQTWLATMSGTVNVQAANGMLSVFNLGGLITALHSPSRAGLLKAAAQSGTSSFTSLNLAATIDHGILKFQSANLQGPAGMATANGTIDVSDNGLALNFTLLPHVSPPVSIGLAVIGGWNNPHKVPALKSALAWQETN